VSSLRGRRHLKLLDRYAGIPVIALLGLRRKRSIPRVVRRVGLMKTAAIGDTALLAGLVDDVKSTFPGARLVVVSGSDNAGVIPLLGGAVDDSIVVSPARIDASVRALRGLDLDVLVDFGSWPRFDALLAALSGARFAAGFETRGQFRHYAYDVTVRHSAAVHERDNYAALLGAIGVIARAEPRMAAVKVLEADRIPEGHFVVFHPWSSGYRHEAKEWAHDRWVSLAAHLASSVSEVVISGGPGEVARSEELAERMARAGIAARNMAGQLSLAELTDLLSASLLVVSVNTGIAHLAALVGARTVSLEGPTPPTRWAPLGPRVRTVVSTTPGSGYLNLGFEYRGQRLDCMDGVSVDAVAAAISDLLSESTGPSQFADRAIRVDRMESEGLKA
jgi:heptosyltransferase I